MRSNKAPKPGLMANSDADIGNHCQLSIFAQYLNKWIAMEIIQIAGGGGGISIAGQWQIPNRRSLTGISLGASQAPRIGCRSIRAVERMYPAGQALLSSRRPGRPCSSDSIDQSLPNSTKRYRWNPDGCLYLCTPRQNKADFGGETNRRLA
ncbi:hypothetical protein PGTUg99_037236 [Puccinia graminis f. sp. tritici]|uniref:Uncharacterized protein n=1 Tax=Puccinia graminis f. sp. tritici TaxID=56615 RepID=A0A5B0S3M7_PUCGR|nr:hypothetical protein PGTUg99_037236 [Puccinia graminis f. sp. tritici]